MKSTYLLVFQARPLLVDESHKRADEPQEVPRRYVVSHRRRVRKGVHSGIFDGPGGRKTVWKAEATASGSVKSKSYGFSDAFTT